VEVLIPDFQGKEDAIRIVVDAAPEVLNHNHGERAAPVSRGAFRSAV